MALRKILTDKDPVLRKKSRPFTGFDGRLHDLLDDLKETLEQAGGAGLAAPQVGILRRCVIVVDDKGEMLELVNPEIISRSETVQDGLEGCLSVPGMWGMVERPMQVRVRAQDRSGQTFEAEGEGIVARCFCHEIDHLDGHLSWPTGSIPRRSWMRCWRRRASEDPLYGHAGICGALSECPSGSGAYCLWRLYPAGQTQEQGNEAAAKSCKGMCPFP